MRLHQLLLAAIVAATASTGLIAQSFVLGFDSQTDGSAANLSAPSGVSFAVGTFSPDLDSEGDFIDGSDRWRVDVDADAVLVRNPSFYDRGAAPSSPNALDAVFDTVLVSFSSPQVVSGFSVRLDNDTFGFDGLAIEFYSVGSSSNTLLGSIPIDQAVPGFLATLAGPLAGVDFVVLPAGALYDDLSFTAVPEPSEWGFLAAGALGAVAWFRSRRS